MKRLFSITSRSFPAQCTKPEQVKGNTYLSVLRQTGHVPYSHDVADHLRGKTILIIQSVLNHPLSPSFTVITRRTLRTMWSNIRAVPQSTESAQEGTASYREVHSVSFHHQIDSDVFRVQLFLQLLLLG
jgi:hypothetical protein